MPVLYFLAFEPAIFIHHYSNRLETNRTGNFKMAKYVIAGKANCPFYAKAELLADELASRLHDFKVHKIVKRPEEWSEWVDEICNEKGWQHKTSPLIWRELVDRGGAGVLLGGCNDFLEMAQGYYGITSHKMSEKLQNIAQENMKTKEENDAEEEERKKQINPLRVCISGASTEVAYGLVGDLALGEVFDMEQELAIILYDCPETAENLKAIAFEIQDCARPLLRSVEYTTDIDTAFKDVKVAILLDGAKSCDKVQVAKTFKQLGEAIESKASKEVKVLVAGGAACLNTYIVSKYAPSIPRNNFCALSRTEENKAKGLLARKLEVNSAGIKDVIIWGDPGFNQLPDASHARVHGHDGAIWGPHVPGFTRSVSEMVHDDKWLAGEFIESLKKTHENVKMALLSSAALLTQLRDWWNGTTTSDIWSLGVISEGWYGVPEGIVFSFPVKFDKGQWTVVNGLLDTEAKQTVIQELGKAIDAENKEVLAKLEE